MTQAWHEALQSDLPAYALGSLSQEEQATIAAHLLECEDCRTILLEYDEVMRLLPHALPVVAPPPAARDLLLARVHETPIQEHRWPRLRLATTRLRTLTAVASLALALVVGALVLTMWDRPKEPEAENPAMLLSELRSRPAVQMLAMTGSQHAPTAVGQIIVDPGDTKAALLVSGLPQLPNDHVYQFWFVEPDNTRLSGGLFTVDTNGAAIVQVDAPEEFSRAWRCGVTEEPVGGSAVPTGRNVLSASYDFPIDMEYPEPG